VVLCGYGFIVQPLLKFFLDSVPGREYKTAGTSISVALKQKVQALNKSLGLKFSDSCPVVFDQACHLLTYLLTIYYSKMLSKFCKIIGTNNYFKWSHQTNFDSIYCISGLGKLLGNFPYFDSGDSGMLTQSFVLAVSGLPTTDRTIKLTCWAWKFFVRNHAKTWVVVPSFFFVRKQAEQNTQPR
jgi:hypothetical protein